MTSYAQPTKICAHCGTENSTKVLASANGFGSVDLDMRPPPMEAHSLNTNKRRCRSCSNCAPDLKELIGTREAMYAVAYRSILPPEAFPELARRLTAPARLAEESASFSDIAWVCLRVAWTCDDSSGYEEVSRGCRRAVACLMEIIHSEGQTMTGDRDVDSILALDLLRRSGQFDAVSELVSALSERKVPEMHRQIYAYEARLAVARDTACHQIVDAVG